MDAKTMRDFVRFVDEIEKDKIAISDRYMHLRGTGTEYVVIAGQVVAKFQDGNLICQCACGNTEETKIL